MFSSIWNFLAFHLLRCFNSFRINTKSVIILIADAELKLFSKYSVWEKIEKLYLLLACSNQWMVFWHPSVLFILMKMMKWWKWNESQLLRPTWLLLRNSKASEFHLVFLDNKLVNFIWLEDYFKVANMAQYKIMEIKREIEKMTGCKATILQ